MLTISNIARSFGTLDVLRRVSLEVTEGEIVCLLGPSGCGKTTLLRIIAGLDRPNVGDVRIDGQSILDIPTHERGFGLMFQDFALFPHMNVEQNVQFGLRMHHVPRAKAHQRALEVLAFVGLEGYEKRSVSQLSGGERQRVALARSLAPNPRLLMLDEPLGSLDAALRERLVIELHAIIKRLGVTAIYVTHDQHEAFAIADRIAVMNAGRIEQIDTPPELYRCPATTFVARFLGFNNIVPVTDFQNNVATTPVGAFPLSDKTDALLLHPDGLEIADPEYAGSVMNAVVSEMVFSGGTYRVEATHEAGFLFSFPVRSREIGTLRVGDNVRIGVNHDYVVGLRDSS